MALTASTVSLLQSPPLLVRKLTKAYEALETIKSTGVSLQKGYGQENW